MFATILKTHRAHQHRRVSNMAVQSALSLSRTGGIANLDLATEGLLSVLAPINTIRAKSLAKFATLTTAMQTKLKAEIINTETRFKEFDGEIDGLIKAIRNKKVDATKFTALTFPQHTFKARVIEDGLYKIDAVSDVIRAMLTARCSSSDDLRAKLTAQKLSAKADAYGTFGTVDIYSAAELSSEQAMHQNLTTYYTVATGEKVTAAGYDATFVTKLIANRGVIDASVQHLIDLSATIAERCGAIEAEIKTSTDKTQIIWLPHAAYSYLSLLVDGLSAVTTWPHRAMAVADRIVKHAYV